MSELDAIKQAVEGARNELTQAKQAAEQAQAVADDKMNAFVTLGLEGVAQVLSTCSDALSAAVTQLGSAYGSSDEAVNGLSGLTDSSQLSQTVTALDAATQKLTSAGQETQSAGAQANDALQHAQQSEVELVANEVAAAIGAIDQATASIENTRTSASEYRTKIDTAGGGLLTETSGSAADNREPTAKIGDPIEAPQMGPDDTSAHRAEVKSTDDDDSTRNKFQRGARAAVRGVGNLKKQGAETTKPVYKIMDQGWEPPNEDQYESSTQADARPTWDAPSHAKIEAHDHAGNLLVLSVLAAEMLSRRLKRK